MKIQCEQKNGIFNECECVNCNRPDNYYGRVMLWLIRIQMRVVVVSNETVETAHSTFTMYAQCTVESVLTHSARAVNNIVPTGITKKNKYILQTQNHDLCVCMSSIKRERERKKTI